MGATPIILSCRIAASKFTMSPNVAHFQISCCSMLTADAYSGLNFEKGGGVISNAPGRDCHFLFTLSRCTSPSATLSQPTQPWRLPVEASPLSTRKFCTAASSSCVLPWIWWHPSTPMASSPCTGGAHTHPQPQQWRIHLSNQMTSRQQAHRALFLFYLSLVRKAMANRQTARQNRSVRSN